MKKIALIILVTLTTQLWAKESRMGGESGGGGDGIISEGELLLREFVNQGEPKIISNNQDFLNSIPDLPELVEEIGKVHPALAITLWNDLQSVRFIHLDTKLELLPKETTTLIGNTGEIQLAVRDGNNIYLSVDALYISDLSALLIHEALHSIIPRKGALHHEGVRAINRYIKGNRGKLERKDLDNLLAQYGATLNIFDEKFNSFFNSSLSDNRRCAIWNELASKNDNSEIRSFMKSWKSICFYIPDAPYIPPSRHITTIESMKSDYMMFTLFNIMKVVGDLENTRIILSNKSAGLNMIVQCDGKKSIVKLIDREFSEFKTIISASNCEKIKNYIFLNQTAGKEIVFFWNTSKSDAVIGTGTSFLMFIDRGNQLIPAISEYFK